MCGRARRGRGDYFAYLINDGKERRATCRQTWEGYCSAVKE
jgi:hypothetical protein